MSVIIVLIAFSMLLALAFLVAFMLSMRNGQFDDTSTPQLRMLFDNNAPAKGKGSKASEEKKL
jgi:cbb3-type cytochrome oxidase maturation protein